ncbi:MAG: UDP-3-O-(3-hydroxymyristoyl)glucosamine N-acyltransferase [Bacteroidia bacterium]|nr:UDP-3-O-(3-hydroxymyristoyl)glucosamine N-acyltransferase [Bacteroidia bacterium]MCX7763559.1 UDP-3-O-(3-hydroxymyristoyl)glucosamine N-acyltransferase [Bacteroidia bacterium]MDW8057891.1 UDP-3-O-(3-hydroxymyristoyl)glucosamine N-acyltransferase [Bacteroidia bacterium]
MKIPPHKAREIAELVGGSLIGDPEVVVTGINEIHRVEPGDITFTDVAKYLRRALESPASVILINQEVDPPPGKALIYTPFPFHSFNKLLEHFQPSIPPVFPVSSSDYPGVLVGKNVVIGEGTYIEPGCQIGHNTVIGPHCYIGRNTIIYPGVVIGAYTHIGSHVVIQSGCVIGGEAFYYKRSATSSERLLSKGRVVIGDYVEIGANTTIDRGVSSDTYIGDHTKIDNLVQIGHDTFIGRNCQIAAQAGIAGTCIIEDGVVLWGQVGIPSGIRIGARATVLAKSGVLTSLEGGKVYFGFIAKEVKKAWREIASMGRLPRLLRVLDPASPNGHLEDKF